MSPMAWLGCQHCQVPLGPGLYQAAFCAMSTVHITPPNRRLNSSPRLSRLSIRHRSYFASPGCCVESSSESQAAPLWRRPCRTLTSVIKETAATSFRSTDGLLVVTEKISRIVVCIQKALACSQTEDCRFRWWRRWLRRRILLAWILGRWRRRT